MILQLALSDLPWPFTVPNPSIARMEGMRNAGCEGGDIAVVDECRYGKQRDMNFEV